MSPRSVCGYADSGGRRCRDPSGGSHEPRGLQSVGRVRLSVLSQRARVCAGRRRSHRPVVRRNQPGATGVSDAPGADTTRLLSTAASTDVAFSCGRHRSRILSVLCGSLGAAPAAAAAAWRHRWDVTPAWRSPAPQRLPASSGVALCAQRTPASRDPRALLASSSVSASLQRDAYRRRRRARVCVPDSSGACIWVCAARCACRNHSTEEGVSR